MTRPPTQADSLGFEGPSGKARRYRDVQTGETISYNAFRRLASGRSSSTIFKVQKFEQLLAGSNNLELALRESDLSGREFEQYRRFLAEGRCSASPFVKEHGRWIFRGARSFQHAFLNEQGLETRALFSGRNLVAMQDYRLAIAERSQPELNTWHAAHAGGIKDDGGHTHHPETQISRMDAALRRMGKRQRTRFHQQQFYATA